MATLKISQNHLPDVGQPFSNKVWEAFASFKVNSCHIQIKVDILMCGRCVAHIHPKCLVHTHHVKNTFANCIPNNDLLCRNRMALSYEN